MRTLPSNGNGNLVKRAVDLSVLSLDRDLHPSLQALPDSFRMKVIHSAQEVSNDKACEGEKSQIVFVDASQGYEFSGLKLARQIRATNSKIPIVILVNESSEEFAQSVLRSKINDYVCSPFNDEDLLKSINRCLEEFPIENPQTEYENNALDQLSKTIVGNSLAIQELRSYLIKVVLTESTVLITGETGTGKELVARAIHELGPRQKQQFICMNCAAVPDTLLESELFGYNPGAFTGAVGIKRGKFELAHKGTILFDEIGDMSLPAQAKLLRTIEEQKVSRLGGKESIPVDTRVVAATNQNLDRLISEGTFRSDLYYRLNVACIHIPPLRDRKEDIPLLIQHYVQGFNKKFNRQVEGLNEEAMEYLFQYSWPGNIRELKKLVEGAFINIPEKGNSLLGLPPQFRAKAKEYEHLPQAERDRILSTLAATNWNRSKAAQELHWSRMTLYRKMGKYQIAKPLSCQDFRVNGNENHTVTPCHKL